MTKNKDVVLAVLTYNNSAFIGKTLLNIEKNVLDHFSCKVIVLDNGSNDDTSEIIGKFSGIKVLRLKKNRFFSGGANFLFDQCKATHVFFMSSDVFPEGTTITRMVSFAEANPDVGLIGCASILPNGTIEKTVKKKMSSWVMHFKYGVGSQIARLFPGAFSDWYYYGSKGFPFHGPTEVDVIQDSFIYIKGELLEKGLRFDERMKLYFTEDDLCLSVRSMGYKVVFYPEVSVRHLLQATLDQKNLNVWKMYLDDCIAYSRKHHGVHGRVLETCVRAKRTLKGVIRHA